MEGTTLKPLICLAILALLGLTLARGQNAPATKPDAAAGAAQPAGSRFCARVQDIARLQGQRTNRLMGYGLVVGLNGTGDGDKYISTMRALLALHRRYAAPLLSEADLKGNSSVAIVTVEVTIPEYGAREGEALDAVVSVIGKAKSLAGGQLLTTPLQFAMFDAGDPATQQIFALAGGRLDLPDRNTLTRAVIRNGATVEADFLYSFIEGQSITLVLDDEHAGWTWAQMVAKAINHAQGEVTALSPSSATQGRVIVQSDLAEALGPKNVRVRIPTPELPHPAGFISRVLQSDLFDPPAQQARVTINRTTKSVSFTGTVTISPTVLQVPGFGTVAIGGASTPGTMVPVDPQHAGGIEFQELLATLSSLRVSPDQLIEAIEHLHKTGTLHAQLRYEE